ncbi:MAG: hypothetical protein RBT80_22920 [Candidatus Vecturithrix sp.]|nr:hypothetical protein [Candidatus Vecturithrix sp.]
MCDQHNFKALQAMFSQLEGNLEAQVRLLQQVKLPAEDGILMETNWHRSPPSHQWPVSKLKQAKARC